MKERLKEYSDRELLEGIIEYNTPTNRNLFDGMIKVLRNISKVKKITSYFTYQTQNSLNGLV